MASGERTVSRHFHCREPLWRTFEQMADELEKPVDELINDAMGAYAQLAGYETEGRDTPVAGVEERRAGGSGGLAARGNGGHLGSGTGASASAGLALGGVAVGGLGVGGVAGGALGLAGASGAAGVQARPHAPPAPPMPSRFGRRTPRANPSLVAAGLTPPPPPLEPVTNGAPLYLVFDNQKYRIDKDQFIIGRGSKSSDLPIKDGNISRKHAAIIRRNGTYFIKDLGSTNGIDFKGMRIDNKRIDEGDVFHLCEYELRFTYKR